MTAMTTCTTTSSLNSKDKHLALLPLLYHGDNLKHHSKQSDWPAPLMINKTPEKVQTVDRASLSTAPRSPDFRNGLTSGVDFKSQARRVDYAHATKRLSPSSQYMQNHLASRPVEDDEDVPYTTDLKSRRMRTSDRTPQQSGIEGHVARHCHTRDVSSGTRQPGPLRGYRTRQHGTPFSSTDRRNMTEPALRHNLDQLSLDTSSHDPRPTSNPSSAGSAGLSKERRYSSSTTGYRSPGTTASSSSSFSSTSVTSASSSTFKISRPSPGSLEKDVPFAQASMQPTTLVKSHVPRKPVSKVPPNSAERWISAVQAQVQHNPALGSDPPLAAYAVLSDLEAQHLPTPANHCPYFTDQIPPVPVRKVFKDKINMPVAASSGDKQVFRRKSSESGSSPLSAMSFAGSTMPPLSTCSDLSSQPREEQVTGVLQAVEPKRTSASTSASDCSNSCSTQATECVSHWSDDDSSEDEDTRKTRLVQRLSVMTSRRRRSSTLEANQKENEKERKKEGRRSRLRVSSGSATASNNRVEGKWTWAGWA